MVFRRRRFGGRFKRRSFRRFSKRRRYGPRKAYTKTTIQRAFARPFSNQQIVSMRYFERTQPTVSGQAGIGSDYFFRANSIFDPDASIGGHQPLGHDQWQSFYNHYLVIGSKIRVKLISMGTDAVNQHIAAIYLQADTGAVSTEAELFENSRKMPVLFGPNTGRPIATLVKGYSPRKFFGVKDPRDNIDRIGGLFGSNPSEQAFWHIHTTPIADNLIEAAFAIQVTIDYKVLLTEPKMLTIS